MANYEGSTTTTIIIFSLFSILRNLEYSVLALEHPVRYEKCAKAPYAKLSEADKERYKEEMEVYNSEH